MKRRAWRFIKVVVLYTITVFIAQNIGISLRNELFTIPAFGPLCPCECSPPPCKCTHVFYDGPWIVCQKELK